VAAAFVNASPNYEGLSTDFTFGKDVKPKIVVVFKVAAERKRLVTIFFVG
jgi:hypothetical protein